MFLKPSQRRNGIERGSETSVVATSGLTVRYGIIMFFSTNCVKSEIMAVIGHIIKAGFLNGNVSIAIINVMLVKLSTDAVMLLRKVQDTGKECIVVNRRLAKAIMNLPGQAIFAESMTAVAVS